MKKILIVVAIISVLLLAGCNKNDEVNNNINDNLSDIVTDNQQEEVINNDEAAVDNTDVGKLDDSKSIVYSIYSQDALLNANTITEIPNVNIDSKDAKAFNDKMNNLAKTIQEQRKKDKEVSDAIANGDESASKIQEDWYNKVSRDWYEGVEYNYYVNGDILSLVIHYQRGYVSGWAQYETYNINTKTGKLLTTLELVNAGKSDNDKISNEQFLDAMKDVYMNELYEKSVEESINSNIGYDGITKTYREMMLDLIPDDANEVIAFKDANNELNLYTETIASAGQIGSSYFVNVKIDV